MVLCLSNILNLFGTIVFEISNKDVRDLYGRILELAIDRYFGRFQPGLARPLARNPSS